MSNQILNLLLIIFMILFIYFIMHNFIYKFKEIKFDNDEQDLEAEFEKSFMQNYYNSSNKINKSEKFDLVTEYEASQNLNDLNTLQIYLNKYNNMITDTKTQIQTKDANISDLLTTNYMIHYIDSNNKANAAAYRESIRYKKNEKYNK